MPRAADLGLGRAQRNGTPIGVVEETLVSHSAEAISHFVGRRTVCDYATIRRFCARGEVLAILFRQAESLREWITYRQIVEHGVLKAAPEIITKVSQRKGVEWLTSQIER